MYKNGDEVLIKATVILIEDKQQGNLVRVEMADSHVIIWATSEELMRGGENDN